MTIIKPRLTHTKRQRNISLLKWHFTWIIAILPVFFHIGKQLLIYGGPDLAELCGKGDLFLVSIVMVSEPLSKIFGTDNKRPAHYIFLILSVSVVLMCTYIYAVTDISPEYRAICIKEAPKKNEKISEKMSDTSHIFAQNTKTDTSFVCCKECHASGKINGILIASSKEEKEMEKSDNDRLWRLLYLSIGTIIMSYCIGLNTLIYAYK